MEDRRASFIMVKNLINWIDLHVKCIMKNLNLKSVSVQVIDSDIALLLPNGVYEIKQMEPKSSRLRRIGFFCVALALFGIVGLGYFCPDKVSHFFIHKYSTIQICDERLSICKTLQISLFNYCHTNSFLKLN